MRTQPKRNPKVKSAVAMPKPKSQISKKYKHERKKIAQCQSYFLSCLEYRRLPTRAHIKNKLGDRHENRGNRCRYGKDGPEVGKVLRFVQCRRGDNQDGESEENRGGFSQGYRTFSRLLSGSILCLASPENDPDYGRQEQQTHNDDARPQEPFEIVAADR